MQPMRSRYLRYLGVALLVVVGCQGMPKATKTGHVVDVAISDGQSVGDIMVNPGDEVRWINKRSAPARVVLIEPELDKKVSCKNHFGGFMAPGDTARLSTSETASICFSDPGLYRYIVRMESNSETGETNVPGAIKVAGQGSRTVGETSDPTMSAK